MAYEIAWKALTVTVTCKSERDPRWYLLESKTGNVPPDHFSLRGEVVGEITERLLRLKKEFGSPPLDLVVEVTERWTFD